MFSLNNKISIRQMQALLIVDIFGTGIITLPRKAAEQAGQDAWLSIAAATALAAGMAWLMGSASNICASESFVGLASSLLSKPVGKLIGVLFAVKLMFNCALELRLFGEIVQQALLPNTPFFAVCAAMLAVSAYAAAKGYEARARLAQILFPVIFAPVALVFVLGLFQVDLTNLLPSFAAGPRSLATGAANAGTAFTGLELMLIAAPYASRPGAVRKGMVQAVAFVGVFMVFIASVTISEFGASEVSRQRWPVLEMMDMIDLPGSFIERQGALIMSFWILSSFAVVNGGLFFSSILLKDVMGKGRHSAYIAVSAAIVLALSCAALNLGQAERVKDWVFYTAGLGFMAVVPAVLLAAARLKAGRARG